MILFSILLLCFLFFIILFAESVACSERSASIASVGNSSLGAHSTATIGNSVAAGSTAADSYHGSGTLNARDNASQHEYPSLTIFDDLPLEVLHEYETATGYGK